MLPCLTELLKSFLCLHNAGVLIWRYDAGYGCGIKVYEDASARSPTAITLRSSFPEGEGDVTEELD